MAGLAFVLASEPKIAQLDVFVLVQQDVLKLEISVDAGHVVHVSHRPYQLGEYLLHFLRRKWSIAAKMVVELVP